MREVVDTQFPYCDTSTQFNFKLGSGVNDEVLNQLCDSQINCMSIMDLICTFQDNIVDRASIIKFFYKNQ